MTMGHSRAFVEACLRRAEKALRASKTLLADGELEDAVSRAYYAMYHAVQGLLGLHGLRVKSHKGALALFGQRIVKGGIMEERFAQALHKAFNARQKGDYEVFAEFEEESVRELIREAEAFVERVKELIGSEGSTSSQGMAGR